MKSNMVIVSWFQAWITPGTQPHITRNKERRIECMTKKDYEEALKIKKQIMELKMVEDAGMRVDKKRLKSLERQLAGFKKQFNVASRNMEREVSTILEMHYLQGWSFRMIQKYLYACNFCESHPRKIVERYFTSSNKRGGETVW